MPEFAKPFVIVAACLLLGACSSGSGVAVTPIAASGFAQASDRIGTGKTYDIPRTTLFSADSDGGRLSNADVSYRVQDNGRPVVVIDDVRYVLTSEGGGVFSTFKDDTDVLLLRIFVSEANVVESVYLSLETEETFTAGFFPVGFDTAPRTIQNTAGSATFVGEAALSARQVRNGALQSGFSDGVARITANFDSNTVRGTLRFDEQQSRVITLPDLTMTLNNTTITGNGFQGQATISANQLGEDLSFDGASFDGRFYGAAGQAVAGTVEGTLIEDGTQAPILLQGVFVADK